MLVDETPVNFSTQLRGLLIEAGFTAVRPFCDQFAVAPPTVLRYMEGGRPSPMVERDMILWAQGFVSAKRAK